MKPFRGTRWHRPRSVAMRASKCSSHASLHLGCCSSAAARHASRCAAKSSALLQPRPRSSGAAARAATVSAVPSAVRWPRGSGEGTRKAGKGGTCEKGKPGGLLRSKKRSTCFGVHQLKALLNSKMTASTSTLLVSLPPGVAKRGFLAGSKDPWKVLPMDGICNSTVSSCGPSCTDTFNSTVSSPPPSGGRTLTLQSRVPSLLELPPRGSAHSRRRLARSPAGSASRKRSAMAPRPAGRGRCGPGCDPGCPGHLAALRCP
mmetsp:Transcript_43262/g.133935  ORF Transcript_43262/g.133935 Transcript_43262/m.133935 type:complete len:260 (+) Transcript_43262:159-938(+)